MKKISAYILIFAMCFSALLTGCVDIWEGIEGDERVYNLYSSENGFYYNFSYRIIKLKKDNSVELFHNGVVFQWGTENGDCEDVALPVSNLGDEYADYNADYRACNVTYGTYKQIGNRLKVTFDSFTEYYRIYEVSGEDAEAFKTAYIENNPDKAEIFAKGYVRGSDNITGKVLTLSVRGNECKPLSFASKHGGVKETWTYDGSGQIESYKSVNGNLQKICKFKFVYIDDASYYQESIYEDGAIKQFTEYFSDGKWASEYDSNGNEIASYYYNSEGNLTTWEYDSNGNLTARRKYDSEGNLINELTPEYDSKGNLTARREYDSTGKLISEETWEYASNGKLTKESTMEYDSDGNLTKKSTEYDSNGKCIAESVYEYDSEGNLMREDITEYDSNGNLTAIREYDSEGNLISEETWTWVYEYDSKGRLVATREYDSDGNMIYEETIHYYD